MNMLYDRSKQKGQAMAKKELDKSPYERRAEKDTKKAFKAVNKSVKKVAEDTNKTRRKIVKPTKQGKPIPKKKAPLSNMTHKHCYQ
jgi:hypothetical protein